MVSVLVALCVAASPLGEESGAERSARLVLHELDELKLALTKPELRSWLLTPEENTRLSLLDAEVRRLTPAWPKVMLFAGATAFVASAALAGVFAIYEGLRSAFCGDWSCGTVLGVGGWVALGLIAVGALVTLIIGAVEDSRFKKLLAPVKTERDMFLLQIAGRHLQNPQLTPPPFPLP